MLVGILLIGSLLISFIGLWAWFESTKNNAWAARQLEQSKENKEDADSALYRIDYVRKERLKAYERKETYREYLN